MKLRKEELGAEWWAKACRKSHEFAGDCDYVESAISAGIESGEIVMESDEEDSEEDANVEWE